MDPMTLLLLAIVIVAAVIWVVLRRRAERGLTPAERLEQAALRAEQDRQRTGAVEGADRFNING